MATTSIAFDLYGTLLSTESIAQQLAVFYGEEKASTIAAQARRYQLEYTWRINSMGMYRPFSDLTRASFRHATAEAGLDFSKDQEERIMKAYDGLNTFPDADAALALLTGNPSLDPYVFSNGTVSMITSSLRTSPSLSQADSPLPASKVISVDALRVYKPDRRTYEHLTTAVGKGMDPGQVWLVSSNPFDVAGGIAAGLKTAWVDRGGAGWIDGLGAATGIEPTLVVKGVDEAVREILKRSGGK
ncbi:hypothetical protein G7046_g2321 [Stylonectria norvegica]|nr:hypothetical protein G7046_g2321 [Stylonectria norvegica]